MSTPRGFGNDMAEPAAAVRDMHRALGYAVLLTEARTRSVDSCTMPDRTRREGFCMLERP